MKSEKSARELFPAAVMMAALMIRVRRLRAGDWVEHAQHGRGRIILAWPIFRACSQCHASCETGGLTQCHAAPAITIYSHVYDVRFGDGTARSINQCWLKRVGTVDHAQRLPDRHTKGQLVMLAVQSEALPGGPFKHGTRRRLARRNGVSETVVSEAIAVFRHAPELSGPVIGGALPLRDAYVQAKAREAGDFKQQKTISRCDEDGVLGGETGVDVQDLPAAGAPHAETFNGSEP